MQPGQTLDSGPETHTGIAYAHTTGAEEASSSARDSNTRLCRLVDGSESDNRRLTVDFGAFMERLETAPSLDHERLARYLAGVDLVRGLSGPCDAGFGRAAPGVSDEAEISEQLYAITDEALAAAEDLMEAVHSDQDDYYEPHIVQPNRERQPELNSELRLALTELGTDGAAASRIALTRVPCATEMAVAEEFI